MSKGIPPRLNVMAPPPSPVYRQGTPPCVYGVRWNPIEVTEGNSSTKLFDFCSYGVKHILFWKEARPLPGATFKRMWSQDPGAFLSKDNPKGTKAADGVEMQVRRCAAALPNCIVRAPGGLPVER